MIFNEEEFNLLEETVSKVLVAVNNRVDEVCDDMAALGKRLADLKTVQAKLMSIWQAIKDHKDSKRSRCNQC